MPLTPAKRDDLLTVLSSLWSLEEPEDAGRYLSDGYKMMRRLPNTLVSALRDRDVAPVSGGATFVGGQGVVIQCWNRKASAHEALKIPRPSLVVDENRASSERLKAQMELLYHLPLSHENIAKVRAYGTLPIAHRGREFTCPFTLLEWVDGGMSFEQYLAAHAHSPEEVRGLVLQALSALEHVHQSGLVHWDIKSDNLLVTRAGRIKLMDLGNAHPLNAIRPRRATPGERNTSLRNLPPRLQDRVLKTAKAGVAESVNRVTLHLGRRDSAWDSPRLDLYMFARELNRLFGTDQETLQADSEVLDQSELKRYAQLRIELRQRLFPSDSEHPSREEGQFAARSFQLILRRLLLDPSPAADYYYETAAAAREHLQRLDGEFGAAQGIRELEAIPQHVSRLPPLVNIPWTARTSSIANSRSFGRLKKHRQLATVLSVYGGARHTRWDHSLGTFHSVLQYVQGLYASRVHPYWRIEVSSLDVRALMLASLLHDLGHLALGHYLEEVPVILPGWRHEAYVTLLLRIGIPGETLPKHVSGTRLERQLQRDASELLPIIQQHWCGKPDELGALLTRTVAILEGRPDAGPWTSASLLDRRDNQDIVIQVLHSLISGDMDADKLDYLARDGHHCAVVYPNGIDKMRLLQTLTLAVPPVEGDARTSVRAATICVSEKGVVPLESLVVARYQMFRVVYWQHTVRAQTAMFQHLVEEWLWPARGRTTGKLDFNERVDEFIAVFRERDDDAALRWLMGRMTSASGRTRDEDDLARDTCRALLGRRSLIYWTALELTPSSMVPGGGPAAGGSISRLSSQVINRWDGWRQQGGTRFLAAKRAFLRELADEVGRILARTWSGARPIRRGELLVDVPVKGKEQVRGLYVVRNGVPVPLSEETPLANAAAVALPDFARRARVFLHPTCFHSWKKLGISENDVERAVRASLIASLRRT